MGRPGAKCEQGRDLLARSFRPPSPTPGHWGSARHGLRRALEPAGQLYCGAGAGPRSLPPAPACLPPWDASASHIKAPAKAPAVGSGPAPPGSSAHLPNPPNRNTWLVPALPMGTKRQTPLETSHDPAPLNIPEWGPRARCAHLRSQKQGGDDNAVDEEDAVQQVAEFGVQQAEALCVCAER